MPSPTHPTNLNIRKILQSSRDFTHLKEYPARQRRIPASRTPKSLPARKPNSSPKGTPKWQIPSVTLNSPPPTQPKPKPSTPASSPGPTNDMDMGPGGTYTIIKPGEGPGGGMMKHPVPGAPSTWLAYVAGRRPRRLHRQSQIPRRPGHEGHHRSPQHGPLQHPHRPHRRRHSPLATQIQIDRPIGLASPTRGCKPPPLPCVLAVAVVVAVAHAVAFLVVIPQALLLLLLF